MDTRCLFMIRNFEARMAQAMAQARALGSVPPLVLPFVFRGLMPFESSSDGWPSELHMPKGMGFLTTWTRDNCTQPANEIAAPADADSVQP